MENKTETIYITHRGSCDCTYYDANHVRDYISTIEAMSLLISRLAGTLQYSDDNNENCEYEIVITKKK